MKKIEIIFITIILCCLVIPILRFSPNETFSQTEKRNLAAKPLLIVEGNLNRKYFEELDSYIQDHFGERNNLIKISKQFEWIIRRTAIKGKDGWFFYIQPTDGANFIDFQKKNLMSKEQIQYLKNNIEDVTKWCDENGIKYLFVVCPNKHSIYSEYYPFARPIGITRADQISQIFSDINVPFVYSRDYLISKKAVNKVPLYYETDTHWNPLGAYYSFEQILPKIQDLFPHITFPNIEYEINVTFSQTSGDILPMLKITNAKSTQITLSPKNAQESDCFKYINNKGEKVLKTLGKNSNLPKAIIFRDSFASSLVQFLSPLFSEAEYNWRQFTELDKEYILKNKPDIIIFEAVERYAPSIVAK